ncbi:MAG: aldo/keto reductase [Gemmatimonadales bacterium]|jgi:aryl-alcohol dehydrogenase-like predicted oxidoreductase
MQQRPLGPGAPEVSAISFGGMPLSIQGRPENEADALEVIHSVLDAGVTLIDTANVYCLDDDDIGHNEHLVAKAIGTWPGDRNAITIATKGGLTRPQGRWERDARPGQLKAACEKSLQALDVECIDLYQLHAPDPEVPYEDSVGALADLQHEGKIRWIGLSNVSVEQIEAARQMVEVVTVQNRLNPFFREAVQTGVVQHCAEHGIGFLAYSPVGGGRLNKKLPGHPALLPISRRLGISPHAVVLAWVLAQGVTVIPIPGARTVGHALDSLTAAGVTLDPEELQAIDEAEFSTA